MRKLAVKNLKIGMTIAQSIYSTSGSIVIPAGTVVQQAHIDRLRNLGIHDVVIDDPRVRDLVIPESISERTRVEAIGLLRQVHDSVSRVTRIEDIEIPYDGVLEVVSDIEDDLAEQASDIVTLIDCPSPDDYLEIHSLNVAILSIATARRAGLGARTKDVGVGALLHDVGMSLIPDEIRLKRGKLEPEEMETVRKHPALGLAILRQVSRSSVYACAIVYQHHERHDGSGYPRGLRGTEIDPLARIVSVADAYCAMTEPRPYRQRLLPQEAYDYLMSAAGFEFDLQTVQGTLMYVAPYPVGTMVKLNTGEKGVVTRVLKGLGTRPAIRVFYDAEGKALAKPFDLDLSDTENQTRLVTEVCDD